MIAGKQVYYTKLKLNTFNLGKISKIDKIGFDMYYS
jgi:hypothetical protein